MPADDAPLVADGAVGDPAARPDVAPASTGARNTWPRTVITGLVGVVAVLALVAGVLGFWTLRTAADSDGFEARVEELLRREDVSNALARRVVDEVVTVLDIAAVLDEVVPEVIRPALNVLLAGVRSRVELGLGEQLREDRFVEFVGAAAGAAHAQAVRVIRGDDVIEGVAVVDGQVTINLLPVVAAALVRFQEIGLLADVTIPTFDRGGDPAEQRAELSEALGRPLPDGFGEIVVLTSDSLDQAGQTVDTVRDILVLARRAFWILLAIGVGFAWLAIRMSVQRWRAAAFLVAGLFTSALVVRWAVSRVVARVPGIFEQPGAQTTIAELARGFGQSVNNTLLAVSVAALLILVGAAIVSARTPRSAD